MKSKQINLHNLEQRIGYVFHNKELLIQAVSHPSLKQGSKRDPKFQDYERLEFLGDAVLSFIITQELLLKFPIASEGELSKLRSYLISQNIISAIAKEINIAPCILMTYGEEKVGGRSNVANLENVLESIIGAIYLDSNITTANQLITTLWHSRIDNISIAKCELFDPKTKLQEILQNTNQPRPVYTIIDKSGKDHNSIFTAQVTISNNIFAVGSGKSKQLAEKAAAELLLAKINKTS